jgi:beta-glucanase (GH16 family)
MLGLAATVSGCSGGGSAGTTDVAFTANTPSSKPTTSGVGGGSPPTNPTTSPTSGPKGQTPTPSASPNGTPTAGATPATPTPGPTPSAGPGSLCFNNALYTVSFQQQFSDLESWRVSHGGSWYSGYPWGRANPGADDAAYYMDQSLGLGSPVYDPFGLSGGALTLTALPVAQVPGLKPSQIGGYQYASGMISTSGQNGSGSPATTFSQRFGYYEVKAQLPRGQGLWPSFWMLDNTGLRAEVDVFEFLGNDTSRIYQSVHYQDGSGGSYPYYPSFDPTTGMHAYGVLITPSVDTYYVDGVATKSVPDASINAFYFMVSLQIGGVGSWPGPPNDTTPWPAVLALQYFRAYAPTSTHC